MSLYEVLNLLPRWPLVFRSFLHPPLVARDVVTPNSDSLRTNFPRKICKKNITAALSQNKRKKIKNVD